MARQIADALDAAHERGIVHRDLKPSNVAWTCAGVVKVLDFGIAKRTSTQVSAAWRITANESDTLAVTAIAATHAGQVLGTAASMSPEQARGHSVDKRADIWAFGYVMFEMLTGSSAFGGATTSDPVVAVLEREPNWHALPAGLPSNLRHLLERCLKKDVDDGCVTSATRTTISRRRPPTRPGEGDHPHLLSLSLRRVPASDRRSGNQRIADDVSRRDSVAFVAAVNGKRQVCDPASDWRGSAPGHEGRGRSPAPAMGP